MVPWGKSFPPYIHGGLFHMANGSPITGIIEENQVIIDFGKYEGKTVLEVSQLDPDFYRRLVDQKDNFAIRRHRDKTFRLYVNPLFNLDN